MEVIPYYVLLVTDSITSFFQFVDISSLLTLSLLALMVSICESVCEIVWIHGFSQCQWLCLLFSLSRFSWNAQWGHFDITSRLQGDLGVKGNK